MSQEQPARQTRTVVTASAGAKVMVVIGVLLAIGAVYLALSPIERPAKDGRLVSCGTAFKLPGSLVRVTCGQANVQRQWQSGSMLAAALVVGFGGIWVYGGSRRVEVEQAGPAAAPEDEPADS